MENESLYMDCEHMARMIEGTTYHADTPAIMRIIGSKSLSELFHVSMKAVYLKPNGCYETK